MKNHHKRSIKKLKAQHPVYPVTRRQTLAQRARHAARDAAYTVSRRLPWAVRERLNRVIDLAFPQNLWARRVIPNHWCDKTDLIPAFLFAAVIDFVDGEDAFNVVEFSTRDQNALSEVYRWAKSERAQMLQEIEDAHPPLTRGSLKANLEAGLPMLETIGSYDRVFELKEEFERIESKHLTWIVRNRALLWT